MRLHVLRALLRRRLDTRHHLLLRDQVINALQQTKQALHVSAPLVQHLVRITLLLEADKLCGAIDTSEDGLVDDQVGDVLFGFLGRQVEKLCEA